MGVVTFIVLYWIVAKFFKGKSYGPPTPPTRAAMNMTTYYEQQMPSPPLFPVSPVVPQNALANYEQMSPPILPSVVPQNALPLVPQNASANPFYNEEESLKSFQFSSINF
jgi:hypothetical protein